MTPPISPENRAEGWLLGMPKMPQDDRFPSRKHPRMKHYDYSTPNYYFVTICTHNKQCLFGKPGKLNRNGLAAEKGILEIGKHFAHIKVDTYTVMPNHVHIILVLEPGCAGLPIVLGQYKSYVTKQIHADWPELTVWQSSYHDHVIRNQKSYENIWLYIEANPANWEKDCFFTE